MSSIRVLLLASEPTTQRRIQLLLDRHELVAVAVTTPAEARRVLRAESFDAVVVDAESQAHLAHIAELVGPTAAQTPLGAAGGLMGLGTTGGAGPPVLALVDGTVPGQLERALELGATDVLERGLLDRLLVQRLRLALRAAGASRGRAPGVAGGSADAALRRAGRRKSDLMVGRSPRMHTLAEQIDMIAKTDIGVAVFGETGTGKDLVARTIHAQSPRAARPYVVANCTALPDSLFENELFGHERGAFTGADTRQEGLLREAEGGTLVLDEIGDLKAGVQAKLLRLLQFREYKLVGGTKTLHADVRILATTHHDLGKAVAEGRFREDLFYRLNTLQITLPPLRERLEDVALLVDHFVALFNEREGRDFYGFSPAAIRALQGWTWPGNVRELESVVYRTLVMAGSRRLIDAADLQLARVAHQGPIDLQRPFAELKAAAVEHFERSYLDLLLQSTGGNLLQAARAAQHERKSLWRLLRKYRIDLKAYRRAKD